jgi:uncharacterized protein YecE (DUF72 family)
MLSDFNETARAALAEKLGCVLYQFPSQFQYQPERLSRIVDLLDTAVNNVLEFRHESWWNPEVYETLTTAGITFCGMSHPNLPETVVGTTDTLYYRMHGVPHLYNSGYEVSKLEQIAHELLSHRNSRQAFVQFNNTAEGHAVLNAQQLQDICELVH